ncbi:McrC family protein [Desulfonatronum thioautotrophicum]|uniref:McrC family protein n=1 Tax=Desulfonatronum thioautotrophicum TaxID=617001 RepID=UPI00069AFB82|nr:hypothetical protein [Desulfonatronum thioautotrophicum]
MPNPVQVFEYSTLPVGDSFTDLHFRRLVQYNERHGNAFFAVGHNRIYFRNYVGVIQVGNLTIEILPKADNAPTSDQQKDKWQKALIDMIRWSGMIRLTSLSDATLRIQSATILDIFFESFLADVAKLVRHGLVRKYRRKQGYLTTLKGRLLFQEQIARNLVHRERFYTEHFQYDRNNLLNQLLYKAIGILTQISVNPYLAARARALSMNFEYITDILVTNETFARIKYNRNTERYRRAIQLARLIILNYCPDVRSGGEDVLAILFDMNELFERYVFAQLKRAESNYTDQGITFKSQVSRPFWKSEGIRKSIRPDIIAQIGNGQTRQHVVLDTKWKVPRDDKPSDADLQQMYTYNIQFGAKKSFLIYPRISNNNNNVQGKFENSGHAIFLDNHTCALYFIELFDENGRLHRDLLCDSIIQMISC